MNTILSQLQTLPFNTHFHIYGCKDSLSIAFFIGFYSKKGPHVIELEGDHLFDEFEQILLFFNPYFKVHKLPCLDPILPSRITSIFRLKCLYHALNVQSQDVFLVSKNSLLQKTIPLNEFKKNTLHLTNKSILPSEKKWLELGYLPCSKVEEEGFFSQKGCIFDIYSPAHPFPIRCEIVGDIISSLRYFDPSTNRSLKVIQEGFIIPANEVLFSSDIKLQAIKNLNSLKNSWTEESLSQKNIFTKKLSKGIFFQEVNLLISFFYTSPSSFLNYFQHPFYFWKFKDTNKNSSIVEKKIEKKNEPISFINFVKENLFFHQFSTPSSTIHCHSMIFDNQLPWPLHVLKKIKSWSSLKMFKTKSLFISSPNITQIQQLKLRLEKENFKPHIIKENQKNWNELLEEQKENNKIIYLIPSFLPCSFESSDCVFLKGDSLLGKFQSIPSSRKLTPLLSKARAFSFSEINKEDLVIDKIHGVCIYKGLKKIQVNNMDLEYVELEFKDKNKMYVPVTHLYRLFKFKSHLSHKVLDSLGSNKWNEKLAKAKISIQSLALDLFRSYSLRAKITRNPFKKPSKDLLQFEMDFPFQETKDQLTAIQDIFKDMTSSVPMDRLIIGDSGFGKTEVSMRAAFKAVEDGYQVALLAPTTILSLQHFQTFNERFSQWPFRIKLLNRFVSPSKTRLILADLQEQKVDILIGSHRLLSSDIVFKNLGLVIIDEEHRFGVKQKEKLKKLKLNVDCIYMSATPIPRTLNMSLKGVKDLSLIHTSPKNRTPPRTFIINFDPYKLKEIILKEIQRGGQIIFIHNRIKSLDRIHSQLKSLLNQLEIRIAHGQMNENELESNVIDFFNQKADLLLCTTIVETGMDFARANTIIINEAQNLGLSQLYQLRGRVGRRAHMQSYCYFVVPDQLNHDTPTVERLNFLQTHNTASSGYQVAQYDLELRGGGDFLGAQQSGHIQNIGHDLFIEMLEERINLSPQTLIEPEITLPWPSFIPSDYMPHDKIRLMYYKYLSEADYSKIVYDIEEEIKDSFGPIPSELNNLIGQVLIRNQCRNLNIKELKVIKNNFYLKFMDQKEKHLLPKQNSWVDIYDFLKSKEDLY